MQESVGAFAWHSMRLERSFWHLSLPFPSTLLLTCKTKFFNCKTLIRGEPRLYAADTGWGQYFVRLLDMSQVIM